MGKAVAGPDSRAPAGVRPCLRIAGATIALWEGREAPPPYEPMLIRTLQVDLHRARMEGCAHGGRGLGATNDHMDH